MGLDHSGFVLQSCNGEEELDALAITAGSGPQEDLHSGR
jgi:hypothetical protein